MTKLRQQSSTTLTYEPNRIRFKFRKIQAFQSEFFFSTYFCFRHMICYLGPDFAPRVVLALVLPARIDSSYMYLGQSQVRDQKIQ